MKIKSIIKYIGFLIIGLLIAALLFPFIFKDRIIEEVKKLANENLNAVVDFNDVNLSLIRSFPKLNLKVEDITITGIDQFEGDTLLACKDLIFDMNITPLFNSNVKPEISYIGLNQPKINVMVTADGMANYDITKPTTDTTTTAYEVPLNKYEIINGDITYHDRASKIELKVQSLTHEGKGNFTNEIFDLETSTQIGTLFLNMDGTTYLNNIPASLEAIFNIDLAQNKYTLKENQLRLRDFTLNGDGFIQLKEDDILMDLDLSSPSSKFSELFTVFPFIPIEPSMNIDGNYTFNASIDGTFNAERSQYPGFNIDLEIAKGKVQYPDLPYPIENINSNIKVNSSKPDMSDLVVNIPNFNFELNNEKTSGNITINKSLSNPELKGQLKTNLTLENWKQALPLEDVEKMEGKITADLTFDGKLSDIESKNYKNLTFDGAINGSELVYKSKNQPTISTSTFDLNASPEKVMLNTKETYLGKSKLDIDGVINDPLAILSEKINVNGVINVNADNLDLNEWTDSSNEQVDMETSDESSLAYLDQLESSDITVNFNSDRIVYDSYELKNTTVKGRVGMESIDIDECSTNLEESDVSLNGRIHNIIPYLNGSGKLEGKININSQNFNANQFLTEDESDEELVNFKVPKDLDVEINTNIKKLKYTDIDLNNFKGQLNVKNEAIRLTNIESEVLSGKINFDGLYDSKEEQPTFDTKIDLSKIQFNEAYQQFLSIKALAPIAKYIDGFFNTTLVFSGKMGESMIPDLTTLNASGYIETLNSTIKGAAPLEAVASKLNISNFKTLKLEDTKNWFEIKNGTVELKENDFEFSNIKSKVKGKHQIQGEMDYELLMNIPRELLQKNNVTKAVDSGLSFLESKAKSIGINIEQGEFIDIKVGLKGTIAKPKITLTPVGSSGQSVQNEVKDEIDQVKQQVKDTIRKEIEKTKEKVVDTIKKTAEKEIDKAKQKAVEEAEKAVDKAKDKAKDKIGEVIDSNVSKVVSDTLTNKVKDAIKNSTGKEVDDIKDKIKDWNPFKKKKGN